MAAGQPHGPTRRRGIRVTCPTHGRLIARADRLSPSLPEWSDSPGWIRILDGARRNDEQGSRTGEGRLTGYAAAELSVAALFTILWDALADLLGTAATATLLKRAAQRAAARSPELAGLVIKRDGLIYRYSCPPAWNDSPKARRLRCASSLANSGRSWSR